MTTNTVTPTKHSFQPLYLLVVGALGAALVWSYWPTIADMASAWSSESEYSHGWLVPVFAVVLLLLRAGIKVKGFDASSFRQHFEPAKFQPNWWGLALIGAALALRVTGVLTDRDWFDEISLLPFLAGLVVLFGGWPMLLWSWPAIAFLIFMVPLPYRVQVALGGQLQKIATIASTYVIQTLGLPALSIGNVIIIDEMRIEVAAACSGLSMLVVFFALSAAVAMLIKRPLGDRVVIFLSAVPIAVASNVIRIIVTALFMVWVSYEVGQTFFHDWAGYFMMALALGFMWLELKLISLILIEPEGVASRDQAGSKEKAPTPGARRREAQTTATTR